MKPILTVMLLAAFALASRQSGAQELNLAQQLVEKMKYSESFDDARVACFEQADGYDVASDVADNPELLGGIKPGDALWPEAKALYIDMVKSGCYYDKDAAIKALEKAIADNLSHEEIKQLIAFYDTPLGQRFVAASVIGSDAAGRAAKPLNDVKESARIFVERVSELIRQGKHSN